MGRPRERISNYFLTKEESGSTIDGPQYDAEMMDDDSDKDSGQKMVWSRKETRGSDKELGEKAIWSRQETGDSDKESGEKMVWSRQETGDSDKESDEKTVGSRQGAGGSAGGWVGSCLSWSIDSEV